jgi:hypothetical protein
MERRLVKVLKGLAEYLDLSLGDLLEGIVLHAFEQKVPFDDRTLAVIDRLKEVYGLALTAGDSHHLESPEEEDLREPVRARAVDRHHRGSPSPGTGFPPVNSQR